MEREISGACITRMPAYLRYLQEKLKNGEKFVSSSELAKNALVSAVLVRKDLSVVSSVAGKPKIGFEVRRLVTDIEKFLGYDNLSDAIVVGAGRLGKAFLGYEGFKNNGLNVLAAFDIDEKTVGKRIAGKKVYSMQELERYVAKNKIRIGILTVPKEAAQETLDKMIGAGIKGVWNFAATPLSYPKEVVVKNEDLSASLALLVNELCRS